MPRPHWSPRCSDTPPTAAQLAVFDASNLVQNTLTAARSLNEVNNQVMQLEHEVTMLQNEARNLTTLPFNIVSQLQATLSSTTQLINQAQGIAFQLQQAQALFNQFYPASYGAGVSAASMAADALQRWTHSLRFAADHDRYAGASGDQSQRRCQLSLDAGRSESECGRHPRKPRRRPISCSPCNHARPSRGSSCG